MQATHQWQEGESLLSQEGVGDIQEFSSATISSDHATSTSEATDTLKSKSVSLVVHEGQGCWL